MNTEANPKNIRSFFIRTEETYYKNERRVKLIFRYDIATTNAVKNLPGARWSEDMHCWHIPYTPDYLSVVKSCINNNNVCIKSIERPLNKPITNFQKELVDLKIHRDEGLIYIKMPYTYEIITQIKKIDGAWWHPGAKLWSVHFTSENLENLKRLFNKKEYLCELRVGNIHSY